MNYTSNVKMRLPAIKLHLKDNKEIENNISWRKESAEMYVATTSYASSAYSTAGYPRLLQVDALCPHIRMVSHKVMRGRVWTLQEKHVRRHSPSSIAKPVLYASDPIFL
jgi:hypothetical protein